MIKARHPEQSRSMMGFYFITSLFYRWSFTFTKLNEVVMLARPFRSSFLPPQLGSYIRM